MVAWDLFGRAIVQRLLGLEPALPYARAHGVLAHAYDKPAPRLDLARVVLDGERVEVLPGGAALLSTTTRADGFVLFPAGEAHFDAGTSHVVYLYG